MVKENERTTELENRKSAKPYEPLKLEMIELGEDVILSSSFNTKGTYNDEWIIFGSDILW
ncbi:MAG: hypothetical protein II988_00330 [Clostridia bacterium]|nr:hypothetical protein [Clostridia bacterium]